jgi:hypothetical protein
MKAPTTSIGQFSLMFVAQLVSFFIIVANTRAFTHGSYGWTTVTDTMFSAQAFCLGKLMMEDPNGRTWWSGLGMTIGGTIGSLLAIFVTKHLGF